MKTEKRIYELLQQFPDLFPEVLDSRLDDDKLVVLTTCPVTGGGTGFFQTKMNELFFGFYNLKIKQCWSGGKYKTLEEFDNEERLGKI